MFVSPLNSHFEYLILNVVLAGGAFGKSLSHKGRAPHAGISAPYKHRQVRDDSFSQPQQESSIVDSLPSTLIMDFPDSRTVRNKYI